MVDNTWHCVVTYLQFHIHICFYAVNVKNRRVIWCRLKQLRRAVSLRLHGFLVSELIAVPKYGAVNTNWSDTTSFSLSCIRYSYFHCFDWCLL